MSIWLIWGIVQVVVGVGMLIEAYFIAKDKIKLSKSSTVYRSIIIAILFFSGSLRYLHF